MNSITTVFNKVLVREFYRTNASLFFIAIGIAGGFMRSQDHIALGELFISSPILLLVPISLWTGYTLHVVKFNRDQIKQKENEFLFNVTLLTDSLQWRVLMLTLSYQLLPLIFYTIFLTVLACVHSDIAIAMLTIGAELLLMVSASFAIYQSLLYPNQERKQTLLSRFLQKTITKPFPFFFIEWVTRRRPLVLLGTKIFSVLILIGITQLYKTDIYDFRLLGMGIVIACAAQINLIQEIHLFDNYHFLILRNLPLRLTSRVAYLTCTILMLMIPEVGVLIKNFPSYFTIAHLTEAVLFTISILGLFYGMLYTKERRQERLLSLVFFLAMGWIIIILFKVPVLLIIVVNFLVGLFYFRKYQHSFEYSVKWEN